MNIRMELINVLIVLFICLDACIALIKLIVIYAKLFYF